MRLERLRRRLGRLRRPDSFRVPEPFPLGAALLRARGEAAAPRRYVVRIPLLYAALASFYIIVSTALVGVWLDYDATIYVVETANGIGFVAVTALLLWLALFYEARSERLEELTFRGLVENLPDAVFVLKLPERRIMYANPGAERLFGYPRAELIGQTTEILHVGEREFAEFDARGRSDLAVSGSYLGEFKMRRKDGTRFPTSHMIALVSDREGGKYAVSVVRDEIERVAHRAELRESEERLRLIAENLRETVWITSADRMKLHYVSPAYARIWGRPVDELYQNPDASLQAVHPEDLDWVRPERTAMPPRDHDIEYRIRRPDGAVRWISDRAVVVRDSAGKAHRIVGIAEDITKRKQQQSELLQAQKMEVLGQLAGGITHDFNNLLMVVLGNAESLMARSRSAHLHPELEEIVVASRHAAALSKRLLRFSRRNDTQRDVVDLNQLIAETCRWLERTIGTQVEIELSLADGLWPVLADRSELQLTIVNLAVNARDAMPDGGSMSIATRNVVLDGGEHGRGRPRDFVAVSLRDTGTGMPVELQERIFEPFFTTKPAGQGTGLGLSIVRECVAECGGEIRVRSQPQRGTTFEIRLPRHDPATLSDYRRDGDGADRFRAAGES